MNSHEHLFVNTSSCFYKILTVDFLCWPGVGLVTSLCDAGPGKWRVEGVCGAEKVIHLSQIPIQMSRNLDEKYPLSNLTRFDSDTLSEDGFQTRNKLKWSKDLTTEMFARVTHLCTLLNIFLGMKPLRSCSLMTETSWCPVTRGYCCPMSHVQMSHVHMSGGKIIPRYFMFQLIRAGWLPSPPTPDAVMSLRVGCCDNIGETQNDTNLFTLWVLKHNNLLMLKFIFTGCTYI